jgi:hypothetical protein
MPVPLSNGRSIALFDSDAADVSTAQQDAAALATTKTNMQAEFRSYSYNTFITPLLQALTARDVSARPITRAMLIGSGSFSGQSPSSGGDAALEMQVAMYQYVVFDACVNYIGMSVPSDFFPSI